jgi:hypothetical protein
VGSVGRDAESRELGLASFASAIVGALLSSGHQTEQDSRDMILPVVFLLMRVDPTKSFE